MDSLLWDQHTCLPLQLFADVNELTRYRRPGGALVSVNAGYSPHTFSDTIALLSCYREAIAAHPHLELGTGVRDVKQIAAGDRVVVVFDLEDSAPLDGCLENLATLSALGVRTLAPTYNYANSAGCGCLDNSDTGLTNWGRALIAEMNAVGMVPDGSHCSTRTGLDMCAASPRPVIYSHSCMRGVWDHPRNITDEQARACADTGGVIGITGVGIFLGPNTPTLEAMTRHLEYAVELVGVEHVGVSSDFSFDHNEFNAYIAANTQLFDESYTRWGPIQWMPPETFLNLAAHLAHRGWRDPEIHAVLGRNFRRVAEQSWVPTSVARL